MIRLSIMLIIEEVEIDDGKIVDIGGNGDKSL